ncbi:hypothetical protein BCR44DRAFT_37155 [Catenaria anguillulae PL171]|uniref:Uncharacterized protein n=1 Tax=Catenaria anguillulae PL171 TaxID=765915 RepID=A0A1Y2HIC0_9FUNG|nr:hypothetical protein BCR44DRAFT_37155 [Catenaria anguillulae PL171]
MAPSTSLNRPSNYPSPRPPSPRPARKVTTQLLVALVCATLIASMMLPSIASRGVTFADAAPSSPSSASAYVGETDMGPLEFFKRSAPAPAGKKSANRVEPPKSGGNQGSSKGKGNGSNQGRKMQEGGNRGGNNGNATCNTGSLERQVADLKNDMARLTQLMEQMARQLSNCNLCQNGGNNKNRGSGGGGNGHGRNMKDGNNNGKRNHGRKGGKRGGGSKKHKKGRGKGKKGGKRGKGGKHSGRKNNGNNGGNQNGGNQNGGNQNGGNQNGGDGQQMPPSKTVVVTAVLSNIGTAPAAVGGAATMAVMDEAEE